MCNKNLWVSVLFDSKCMSRVNFFVSHDDDDEEEDDDDDCGRLPDFAETYCNCKCNCNHLTCRRMVGRSLGHFTSALNITYGIVALEEEEEWVDGSWNAMPLKR